MVRQKLSDLLERSNVCNQSHFIAAAKPEPEKNMNVLSITLTFGASFRMLGLFFGNRVEYEETNSMTRKLKRNAQNVHVFFRLWLHVHSFFYERSVHYERVISRQTSW